VEERGENHHWGNRCRPSKISLLRREGEEIQSRPPSRWAVETRRERGGGKEGAGVLLDAGERKGGEKRGSETPPTHPFDPSFFLDEKKKTKRR